MSEKTQTTTTTQITTQETETQQRSALDAVLERTVVYRPMDMDDDIKLTPAMVQRYFCRPTRSGKRCSVEHAIRFLMLCQARRLNPWLGDAYIVGYDTRDGAEFTLVTSHQAVLKRAARDPRYRGMRSGVTVVTPQGELVDLPGDLVPPGGKLVGGWAEVHVEGLSHPVYRRLKLDAFMRPNHGRWEIDPAGMICKCAEADALRSAFPCDTCGLYTPHEPPLPDSVTMEGTDDAITADA